MVAMTIKKGEILCTAFLSKVKMVFIGAREAIKGVRNLTLILIVDMHAQSWNLE
jgi:hypothetical protein